MGEDYAFTCNMRVAVTFSEFKRVFISSEKLSRVVIVGIFMFAGKHEIG
jgi:hypothetical protein